MFFPNFSLTISLSVSSETPLCPEYLTLVGRGSEIDSGSVQRLAQEGETVRVRKASADKTRSNIAKCGCTVDLSNDGAPHETCLANMVFRITQPLRSVNTQRGIAAFRARAASGTKVRLTYPWPRSKTQPCSPYQGGCAIRSILWLSTARTHRLSQGSM